MTKRGLGYTCFLEQGATRSERGWGGGEITGGSELILLSGQV